MPRGKKKKVVEGEAQGEATTAVAEQPEGTLLDATDAVNGEIGKKISEAAGIPATGLSKGQVGSMVKVLVRGLYDAQDMRIRQQLRIKRLERDKIMTHARAKEFFHLPDELLAQAEKEMEKLVAAEIRPIPIVRYWLGHVRGVGPRLTGLFLANIPVETLTNKSKLWAYAGLAVEKRLFYYNKPKKGEKGPKRPSSVRLFDYFVDEAAGVIRYRPLDFKWVEEEAPAEQSTDATGKPTAQPRGVPDADPSQPETLHEEEDLSAAAEAAEVDDSDPDLSDLDAKADKPEKPRTIRRLVKTVMPEQTVPITEAYVRRCAQRRVAGETSNWNNELRVSSWKVASSFLKSGGPYAAVYAKYKRRIVAREIGLGNSVYGTVGFKLPKTDQAGKVLLNPKGKIRYDSFLIPKVFDRAAPYDADAYADAVKVKLLAAREDGTLVPDPADRDRLSKEIAERLFGGRIIKAAPKNPEWSLGRIHNMACRYIAKMFLGHLWIAWRRLAGLPCRVSYADEYLQHSGDRVEDDPWLFVDVKKPDDWRPPELLPHDPTHRPDDAPYGGGQ